MCLKSKNEIIEKVSEPVECYKVLCTWVTNENYWSPVYYKKWVIGECYKEDGLLCDYECGDGYVRYYSGFHACLTYEGAVRYMECLQENSKRRFNIHEKLKEFVILKCKVPIGAAYCIGEDDCYGIDGLVCWEIEAGEIVGRFDSYCKVIEEKSNSSF